MPTVLHILPHPGGGGESIVDMLESTGQPFEHRRAHLTRSRSPLAAAAAIAAGRPRLVAEIRRADLLHVVGDVSALLSLPHLGGRPSVLGTHGLHLLRRAGGLRARLVRRGMRAAIARSAICVCTSEPERDLLAAIAGPADRDKLEVVLNGVPLPDAVAPAERAAARRALGLGESEFVALYLGQLEERKRPLTAARAVQRLDAGVLLVAGDGPQRAALERIEDPRVRVLGFRDDPERLLAAADVLVLPSEREGLSLAVLEAMGRGVPAVVSDGVGNPEAVGDAGVVVPVGDEGALAAALARLAAEPVERARLGAAGRERVATAFGVDRFVADMRDVFERALARAPARAGGAGGA
jgi:glycosyltransferase involved in cell wall biosynthesis